MNGLGNIRTPNKFVATEVFGDTSTKLKVSHGVAVMETKLELKPLKVVFDNYESGVFAGDTVYVQADAANRHAWAKVVYSAKGKSFILVPEEQILLVEPDASEVNQSKTSAF